MSGEGWRAAAVIVASRQRPRAAPRTDAGALAQILGGDLVDRLRPAPLQRIAHVELQAADALDLDGRVLAVLERADALVVGPEEEEVARLQRDHAAHPDQALFHGEGD